MKITGFCPLIVTKDPEAVKKVFEELGFERRHTKKDIEGGSVVNYSMKNESGFRLNIAGAEAIQQDITSMSINVDNFQEAYDFFIAHGFIDPRGDKVTHTGSSVSTMLISPSGFPVTISEHIKKDKPAE